jgi:hypothetical protein
MQRIGHAACIGQKKHAHKIVEGTPEGNKPPDDVCTDMSRCADTKIDLKRFGTQQYTLYLLECKTRFLPLSLVFKYVRSS